MKKFAVIGQPIKHSLSPRIHCEFAKDTGIDISYEAIEVDPKNFKQETIKLFKDASERELRLTRLPPTELLVIVHPLIIGCDDSILNKPSTCVLL